MTEQGIERDNKDKFWQAYTLNTPHTQAEDLFTLKYGYTPTETRITHGLLLLGPVECRSTQCVLTQK